MPTRNKTINCVARSPLLRKGGPHIISKTGQRVRSRLTTHNAVDEWLDELEDDNDQQQTNGEPVLPIFLPFFRSSCVLVVTKKV